MRDEYFLIRGEYHEFYHPDGIRAIRMRSARYPPQGFVEFVEFVFSKIKRQILPDSNKNYSAHAKKYVPNNLKYVPNNFSYIPCSFAFQTFFVPND